MVAINKLKKDCKSEESFYVFFIIYVIPKSKKRNKCRIPEKTT
jgi:hypothetical protein